MKYWIFLFLLISMDTYSQVMIYAKAGGNFSYMNLQNNNSKLKPGFYGGGGADVNIKGKLGTIFELLYSQKGGINKAVPPITKTKTRLDYFSLPLLLYYQITSNIKLLAGSELSLLLAAKAKNGSFNGSVKDIFESFDKGIAFGGEFRVKRFGLDLRFIKGLNGIIEITTIDPSNNNFGKNKTGNNNCLQVGGHYYFN